MVGVTWFQFFIQARCLRSVLTELLPFSDQIVLGVLRGETIHSFLT